jgi:hypothetical protein
MKSTSTFFSKAPAGTCASPRRPLRACMHALSFYRLRALVSTHCADRRCMSCSAHCGDGIQEQASERRRRSRCATSIRPCLPWARTEASLVGTQKAPVHDLYPPLVATRVCSHLCVDAHPTN